MLVHYQYDIYLESFSQTILEQVCQDTGASPWASVGIYNKNKRKMVGWLRGAAQLWISDAQSALNTSIG